MASSHNNLVFDMVEVYFRKFPGLLVGFDRFRLSGAVATRFYKSHATVGDLYQTSQSAEEEVAARN